MNPARPALMLLVDDEEEFATVMAKRLARRGPHVDTAFSGQEVVRLARSTEFDSAVVEIKMEVMDGVETLKTLKMLLPNIKVIMLTGHGSAENASQGMALGAYDYLTNPCDIAQLLTSIQQVLNEGQGPCLAGL